MPAVRPRRLGVRASVTVLLAVSTVLALSACAGGGEPGAAGGSTPGGSSTPSESAPSESPGDGSSETGPGGPRPAKIRVAIEGDIVTAPERVAVEVGQTVRILVTSDVTDELHVHGIDETLLLPPNERQTLEFVVPADPGPGLYEVELHTNGLLLFQLEVR